MDTFTTVLSVFSTVCAIVFGYIAFVRNRDKDKESNVKHDATVLTECRTTIDLGQRKKKDEG